MKDYKSEENMLRRYSESIAKMLEIGLGMKTKVIFNPPATILIMDGQKYVAKAHDEPFDEEKGLLMCLAKANGITHSELKRMLKNAKRQYNNRR